MIRVPYFHAASLPSLGLTAQKLGLCWHSAVFHRDVLGHVVFWRGDHLLTQVLVFAGEGFGDVCSRAFGSIDILPFDGMLRSQSRSALIDADAQLYVFHADVVVLAQRLVLKLQP